ncbi:hypothetical protein N7520_001184 [Penicillium odoratum]|uniref:uncharacterized protein n=1 Tax=Penicillium odoratum TaxID=1167516 RepID=UPI0025498147|nr:uncharacterized protein N7520_001184 [Penicillium odoratum]KAJ5777938.1 hypothetical protein N7520_001184 [Penicillium odoratum]
MSIVTATQGPVEARSLSSITAIASNPPAYPRNPTHEKLDPLVLYIVRVPGSQDIFLSPVKPPTKSSVSAEAINASLFYLHVATPEDDALLQEVEREREKEAQRRREELEAAGLDDPSQREFARLNNPRRKPVGRAEADPDTAPALAPDIIVAPSGNYPPALPPRRPAPMPQVSAENISFSGTPVTNASPGLSYDPVKTPLEPGAQSPISRRPLTRLRPTEAPFGSQAGNEAQRMENRWSAFVGQDSGPGSEMGKERHETYAAGRHSLDAYRPPLPPRSPQHRTRSPLRSPEQSPSRQKRAPRQPLNNNAGFRLTLIRRDPASGTQWNVATISTPHMDHNAIDIDITTPGYNRFAGSNEPMSLASLAANLPAGFIRTAGSSIPPQLHANQPSELQQQKQQPQSGPRKFHRQLCVSKSLEDPSASSEFGNGHDKLKSGYYVFNSPWNGTCTFASSVNGRSLKCKHMIPGPSSPQPGENDPNPAVTVAEIRFNTPFQAANLHYHAAPRSHTSNQYSPTSTYDPSNPETHSKRTSLSQFLNPNNYARPRAHSGPNAPVSSNTPDSQRQPFDPAAILRRTSLRAGKFAQQQTNRFGHQHFHRRSTSTSSGDSDEDRLDFSLARELAGGGMRGKSAKLGKLIIEDEGIKMLDLVVSACMAVWWRGYYH